MDQTHIGYTYWQEPPLNAMPAVTEVQPAVEPRMGVSVEGSVDAFGPIHLDFGQLPTADRFIDVFNRGVRSFNFTARASEPWIVLSTTSGQVSKAERVLVSVDWANVPVGKTNGEITIAQEDGAPMQIRVNAFHPQNPARESVEGFVEGDGYVSMEAEHYTRATTAGEAHWDRIPEYGETLSGMTVFPVTAASALPKRPTATLEYRMYLFDKGNLNLETIIGSHAEFCSGARTAVYRGDGRSDAAGD